MSLCQRQSGKAGLGCSMRLVGVRRSSVCGKPPLQFPCDRRVKVGVKAGWSRAGCVVELV